jgi:hypothetical protein
MPISQYVDTFFFISLGVTFILLFLVAFHFKTRISQVERKNETLTEICTTLVSEIGLLKTCVQKQQVVMYDEIPNVHYSNLDTMVYTPGMSVVEHEDEDDDSDESDDDDEEEGEESEHALEQVIVVDDVDIDDDTILDEENDVIVSNPVILEDEHKIVLMDQNILDVSLVDDSKSETTSDIIQETVNDVVEEIELDIQSEMTTPTLTKNQGSLEQPSMNDYSKMTLQNLRTVVIREGLCADPSKIKKRELLNLVKRALSRNEQQGQSNESKEDDSIVEDAEENQVIETEVGKESQELVVEEL